MDPSELQETAIHDPNHVTLAVARRVYPTRIVYDPVQRRTTFYFNATPTFQAISDEFIAHGAVMPFDDIIAAVKTVRGLMARARQEAGQP